jgi:hypothetical protein
VESSFQDIRITGLDTNKSQDLPSQDGTHRIYLTLSSAPPATWRDIFHRERATPRSSIWRNAIIESMFIVITCTPDELEKHHLKFLKEDVNNTNEKYKLSIAEKEDSLQGFIKARRSGKNDWKSCVID